MRWSAIYVVRYGIITMNIQLHHEEPGGRGGCTKLYRGGKHPHQVGLEAWMTVILLIDLLYTQYDLALVTRMYKDNRETITLAITNEHPHNF